MTYFRKASRRDLANAQRFTEAQEERIRYLAAYGPGAFKPETDVALAAAGWLQLYDEEDSDVDLCDLAQKQGPNGNGLIFDRLGKMHSWLCHNK